MTVDFTTGAITGGNLVGDYGFSSAGVTFTANFDGQLRNGLADLNVTAVTFDSLANPMETGLPAQSAISGALTGPNADAMVGGFSLTSPTRHAEGVFAIPNLGSP